MNLGKTIAMMAIGVILVYFGVVGIPAVELPQFQTAPTQIYPSHDTYVIERVATRTHGDSIQLAAGCAFGSYPSVPRYRAYLQWDLSGVSSVASAIVRIKTENLPTGWVLIPSVDVYLVADAWDESTLDWTKQPPSLGKIGSWQIIDHETWHEFDVTAYVQQELSGDKTFSIMLRHPTESDGGENVSVDFYSKESANLPALIVESGGTPPPNTGTLKIFVFDRTSGQYISLPTATLTDPDGYAHGVSISSSGYVDSNAKAGTWSVSGSYGSISPTYDSDSGTLSAGSTLTLSLEFGSGSTPPPPPNGDGDILTRIINFLNNPMFRYGYLLLGIALIGYPPLALSGILSWSPKKKQSAS